MAGDDWQSEAIDCVGERVNLVSIDSLINKFGFTYYDIVRI